MARITLSSLRKNPLYLNSIILHGNGKLLDYDNPDTGEKIRYAQFNTRAIKDCPFRTPGCEAVCYATKGNHVFPSVTESRERSYQDSRRHDFTDAMVYTIKTEKQSKRYTDAEMRIRIHESGDFYSVQYLRKWVYVWNKFHTGDGVAFTLYTKSAPFFLKLTPEQIQIIREAMEDGVLSINLSVDDTTTPEQMNAILKVKNLLQKANFYRVTRHYKDSDDVCDCANCAKCGACNKATGKEKVVKIHSASNADIEVYDANVTAEG